MFFVEVWSNRYVCCKIVFSGRWVVRKGFLMFIVEFWGRNIVILFFVMNVILGSFNVVNFVWVRFFKLENLVRLDLVFLFFWFCLEVLLFCFFIMLVLLVCFVVLLFIFWVFFILIVLVFLVCLILLWWFWVFFVLIILVFLVCWVFL